MRVVNPSGESSRRWSNWEDGRDGRGEEKNRKRGIGSGMGKTRPTRNREETVHAESINLLVKEIIENAREETPTASASL